MCTSVPLRERWKVRFSRNIDDKTTQHDKKNLSKLSFNRFLHLLHNHQR